MNDMQAAVERALALPPYLQVRANNVQEVKDDFERALIKWALSRVKYAHRAAPLLGMSRGKLRRRCIALGIDVPESRQGRYQID